MAWDQRDRAQPEERNRPAEVVSAVSRSRDLSAEHRGEPVERETIGERGERKRIDTTAGDEGIDESSSPNEESSLSKPARKREADKGGHRMAGNQPATKERAEEDVFGGQGGQKGGVRSGRKEGTGYTGDRRGQLQRDDSLTGTQGRHGRGGSRHGASGDPRTGTGPDERVGGQTAQNPRVSKDKED